MADERRVMQDQTESEDLGHLLASRAGWFRLELVQSPWGGDSWDIALRIDGAYRRGGAEDMLGYWRERIAAASPAHSSSACLTRWAGTWTRPRCGTSPAASTRPVTHAGPMPRASTGP